MPDAEGAGAEFCVGRIELDHEVADDLAEPDHGKGGHEIEDQLGGGAGFESGGTSQEFRADIGGDDEVWTITARRLEPRIETEEDGFCSVVASLPKSAPDERSASAGGDADHDIMIGDGPEPDCFGAGIRIVLSPFDGFPQGAPASGDDALDLVGVSAKCGRAFAGVKHAEPAAGAGADVEEASAASQGAHDPVNGALEVGAFAQQGGRDESIFVQHEFNGPGQGKIAEPHRAWIALFGGRVDERIEAGTGNCRRHGFGRRLGGCGKPAGLLTWMGAWEVEAGEFHCAPDTGPGELADGGFGMLGTDEPMDELGIGRLPEQDTAGEDELEGLRIVSDLFDAGTCVVGEVGGRGTNNIPGDRIGWIGGKDFGGERGDRGFVRALDPGDPFFGGIGLELAEQSCAERGELAGAVEVPEGIAQGAEADSVTAAAIAEEMAPAAGFGGSSVRGATVATGAGAAEDEDPGRVDWDVSVLIDGGGHQRGFEVVGGVAGDGGPGPGRGLTDPLTVGFGAGAGQTDCDRVRLGQGAAQSAQQSEQSRVAEELDVGRAGLGLGKALTGGAGHQRVGMRGSPFDAQEESGLISNARICHGPSIFGPWRFASVAAWNWRLNGVWEWSMTENEKALHAALVELEAAAKPAPEGSTRPDLMILLARIDQLTVELPPETDRELLHFLHRKSYEKARQWLDARARAV